MQPFFLLFPKPHLFGRFWPFPEAKVKFSRSQMLVKNAKNMIFSSKLTNFLLWSIFKSPQNINYICNRISRALVLIQDLYKLRIKIWSFFGVFELRTFFWAIFRYRSEKCKTLKSLPGINLHF